MATLFKLAKAQMEHDVPNASGSEVEKKPAQKNKQRVLALSSRGINPRQRHLLNDLEALLPHFKKDSKLDRKSQLGILNELAQLNNCNNCIFFEVRRREDLYLWTSKTPNGPSIKFHVQNRSRPILSFDKNFDSEPHLKLIKEVFTHIFGIPRGARRSKPFVDHVISFSIADGRIWFRNYQIIEKDPTQDNKNPKDQGDLSLVEIGPRFVLNIIRIFEGSFNGATLFANPEFVTPAQIRRNLKMEKAARYQSRVISKDEHRRKLASNKVPEGSLPENLRSLHHSTNTQ